MNKIRVGVLMGGKSIEREVSFNSGRTICDHLDAARYDITPLFQTAEGELFILPITFLHRGKTTDFVHRLEMDAQKIKWDDLKKLVDFIYIALHGKFAEDGTLQGMLEVLKIPYLGSKLLASALRIDKNFHKKILVMNGIEVPRWINLSVAQVNEAEKNSQLLMNLIDTAKISFPCVVKPQCEGSSLGVQIIDNKNDLIAAVLAASWVDDRRQQGVVIEEKIEGMEFTCIVLTDNKTGSLMALPPTEVIPESGKQLLDYDQKYMPGRGIKITPARISFSQTLAIQEASIKTMRALGMTTMARIDGFLTADNRVIIVDPNSLSGTDPSSFIFRQAAEIGMSHSQLINHLIETELMNYDIKHLVTSDVAHQEVNKIRVAVLFGGESNEREISLESGRNVVYKLSPHSYEAIPIFVTPSLELYRLSQQLLVRHSTAEILGGLTPEIKIDWADLPAIADFVFIGLHGGVGENGSVQGTLEMLGMPYNGSGVLTSALCMDKFKTTQLLKYHGFAVPEGTLMSKDEWAKSEPGMIAQAIQKVGLPAIVKPHDDGCSVLVHKVFDEDELKTALENLFAAGKSAALIEEYVQGMELTVGVIGNDVPRALPPSQAIAAAGILSTQEKFLPGAGENQTPAPLLASDLELVKQVMEEAYKTLNCRGYVRIDCFFEPADSKNNQDARVVILEVNTLPALTPATCLFHQAAEIGIRPMEFIDMIVNLGFQEHSKRSERADGNASMALDKQAIV